MTMPLSLTRRILASGKDVVRFRLHLASLSSLATSESAATTIKRDAARPFLTFAALPLTKSPAPVRWQSTKSSTSAIEYKLSHPRRKAPPLPVLETPTPTAEEAVTNILYNTPQSALAPVKRHVLNCLVQNEPGVLSRVSGILAARGFNIDSLVVASTEASDLSRMTIVLRGQDDVIEQARRQLEDLVPVWAVLDYTRTTLVEREMLLVKVSILGPEHVHEQLAVVKHEEYNDDFMPEADLTDAAAPNATSVHEELSLSDTLRLKHAHLRSLHSLAQMFGGKLTDITNDAVIIELTAKPTRLDAFLRLVKPFGILETARSGMMALPRTPIHVRTANEPVSEDADKGVDATMLPPG